VQWCDDGREFRNDISHVGGCGQDLHTIAIYPSRNNAALSHHRSALLSTNRRTERTPAGLFDGPLEAILLPGPARTSSCCGLVAESGVWTARNWIWPDTMYFGKYTGIVVGRVVGSRARSSPGLVLVYCRPPEFEAPSVVSPACSTTLTTRSDRGLTTPCRAVEEPRCRSCDVPGTEDDVQRRIESDKVVQPRIGAKTRGAILLATHCSEA